MNEWNNYHEHWNKATSLEGAKYLVGSNSASLRNAEREYMKNVGLQPQHKFLDLGCGCLRGTIDLVNYLDDGNFYGLDVSETLINFAGEYIKQEGFENKKQNLKVNSDFDFEKYFPKIKYDFVLAASVLTHIYSEDTEKCLKNIAKVLNDGGSFYATIFVLPEEKNNIHEGNIHISYYKLSWLKKTAESVGLKFEDIGKTIIGQHMVRFYK